MKGNEDVSVSARTQMCIHAHTAKDTPTDNETGTYTSICEHVKPLREDWCDPGVNGSKHSDIPEGMNSWVVLVVCGVGHSGQRVYVVERGIMDQ